MDFQLIAGLSHWYLGLLFRLTAGGFLSGWFVFLFDCYLLLLVVYHRYLFIYSPETPIDWLDIIQSDAILFPPKFQFVLFCPFGWIRNRRNWVLFGFQAWVLVCQMKWESYQCYLGYKWYSKWKVSAKVFVGIFVFEVLVIINEEITLLRNHSRYELRKHFELFLFCTMTINVTTVLVEKLKHWVPPTILRKYFYGI